MTSKEIAKFFCGFAANQVLTKRSFRLAGTQFVLFGITYIRALNATAADRLDSPGCAIIPCRDMGDKAGLYACRHRLSAQGRKMVPTR